MRRRTVGCAVFAFALVMVALPSQAATVGGPSKPAFQRPIIRIDDAALAPVTVPVHAPVPASSTGIGPGSQIMIQRPDGGFICTANFIWTKTDVTQLTKRNGKLDRRVAAVVTKTKYLGAAGHCFLPVGRTSTHGTDADFDPSQARVSVCVDGCEFGDQIGPILGTFVDLGPVAHARQTKRGIDPGNDFGIVEIPQERWNLIREEVPVWEGPSSVSDVTLGGGVCLYGNGIAFGEAFPTKARAGIGQGLDETQRWWKAEVPSAQGDSGSALVTCGSDEDGLHGRGAAGILTHISPANAAIIGTTTSRAVEMVKQDAGIDLQLVLEDGSEVTPPPLEPLPEPVPVTPNESVHPVGLGGNHAWSAGPFTRQAPADATFFGDDCSGVEPASEHCDYEFVGLTVPDGGATLEVTVSTADATGDDFDLFVFGPEGDVVDTSLSSGTPPEVVSANVARSGTYTIAVDPFGVTDATYSGVVALEPPPPPPVDEFDGEVSPGGSYSWTGAPPAPANPAFTCADPANAFCDDERVKVNVPAGGAVLTIDVRADVAGDDFDVCVYDTLGAQTCASEAGDEHLVLPVTTSGVYRVGTKAFLAPSGGYSATASLS